MNAWKLSEARERDATFVETTPGHAEDDRRKLLALVDLALQSGCSDCDGNRTRWYGVNRGWQACDSFACRFKRAAEEGR